MGIVSTTRQNAELWGPVPRIPSTEQAFQWLRGHCRREGRKTVRDRGWGTCSEIVSSGDVRVNILNIVLLVILREFHVYIQCMWEVLKFCFVV